MPASNPYDLALRQADQGHTDFANLESALEFLMQRVNSLPSASDLWRVATLIAFVSAMPGIVGIEYIWHYLPCSSS